MKMVSNSFPADLKQALRFIYPCVFQIAMKASNDKLLHLIENIMRRYKPSILTPDAARSSRSSHGDERLDTAVYENCGQQGNQSPRSTTTEVHRL